jgi:hypothetical protein
MANKNTKSEKFYTPEEVAVAILKKTQELMKASALFKANTSHEVEEGEEPNNEEAEAPEYLANADIEDSGAHGEKKSKKAAKPGLEGADKDGDGDIDGDDAIEAQEEISGKDLDGDKEAGEPAEHKEKIDAAAKPAPKADEDKDADEKIEDASKEAPDKKKEDKKPAFMKSEKECSPEADLKKPSLKKFMLQRKMKKASVPTSDARAAEKLSGAPAAPAPQEKIKEQKSPAEKVKAQPKLQMEKNKATEKLLNIKPKAGK